MKIIGISGKKRSGKDTVAWFIKEWGERHLWAVQRRAFADALKEEVKSFLTCELMRSGVPPITAACEADFAAVTESGKEKIRPLLQWWGTEFRRNMCSEDYWLRQMEAWLAKPPPYPVVDARRIVVIPDVRMPNECEWVRQRGGLLVRVQRPSVLTGEDWHETEIALDGHDDWDVRLDNDGELDELKQQVFRFCAAKVEASQ